jgi:hypothetical protein
VDGPGRVPIQTAAQEFNGRCTVSDYTIGEFAAALNGLVASLDNIADKLKEGDQDAQIDTSDGIKILCGLPIVVGETCVAPIPPTGDSRVADLVVTVESIRDWIEDVRSKLATHDPAARIDSGPRRPRKGSEA